MFKFITNRPFWVNLLAAFTLAFLLVFLILQLLGWLTRHGEYLIVPAVTGKGTKESIKLLESKGFDINIVDSIYTDSLPNGTIIKQLPDANATVKVNRTVFLTVNRYVPPMIIMPALEGKSLGFALNLLQRNHLQLGDTVYKPDFMKGSILEQQYAGAKILPGTKVQWGSKIGFIIAGGLQDQAIMVPNLIGKTYAEAKTELEQSGITLGAVIAKEETRDTAAAFIYKQNPVPVDEQKKPLYIRSGQLIDLWISPVMIYLEDSADNKINK